MPRFESMFIVLIAVEWSYALECHYCDQYSSENKCQFGESPEECDNTSTWCEVEWSKGLVTMKQCSDKEALPPQYTGDGALKCKETNDLVHCYCQGDNCNRVATRNESDPEKPSASGGARPGFWVGAVGGPLLAIGAVVGGAMWCR